MNNLQNYAICNDIINRDDSDARDDAFYNITSAKEMVINHLAEIAMLKCEHFFVVASTDYFKHRCLTQVYTRMAYADMHTKNLSFMQSVLKKTLRHKAAELIAVRDIPLNFTIKHVENIKFLQNSKLIDFFALEIIGKYYNRRICITKMILNNLASMVAFKCHLFFNRKMARCFSNEYVMPLCLRIAYADKHMKNLSRIDSWLFKRVLEKTAKLSAGKNISIQYIVRLSEKISELKNSKLLGYFILKSIEGINVKSSTSKTESSTSTIH